MTHLLVGLVLAIWTAVCLTKLAAESHERRE